MERKDCCLSAIPAPLFSLNPKIQKFTELGRSFINVQIYIDACCHFSWHQHKNFCIWKTNAAKVIQRHLKLSCALQHYVAISIQWFTLSVNFTAHRFCAYVVLNSSITFITVCRSTVQWSQVYEIFVLPQNPTSMPIGQWECGDGPIDQIFPRSCSA